MKIINRTTKNIAILYADSDASLRQELCKHLKPMQRNGQIALIESAERQHVPHLDIILTLVSPAFLAIALRNHSLMRNLQRSAIATKRLICREGSPLSLFRKRDHERNIL